MAETTSYVLNTHTLSIEQNCLRVTAVPPETMFFVLLASIYGDVPCQKKVNKSVVLLPGRSGQEAGILYYGAFSIFQLKVKKDSKALGYGRADWKLTH